MRIIKIIIITIIVWLFVADPILFYIYNKTYWKWETDCMIQYIQKHYPNGCEYIIESEWEKFPHIDKCWLENEYMKNIWEVKWCRIRTNAWANIPYCYYTLFFEKILN